MPGRTSVAHTVTDPGNSEHDQRAQAERQFAEASALMAQRERPADWDKGIALFEAAAALGSGAAAGKLATFHAMAANGPRGEGEWDRSFDLLVEAAELGSEAAAAQLFLLADPQADPVVPAAVGPGHWREVRSRIAIERLLQSPPRRSLSDTPRLRVIEGFATSAECRWIRHAQQAKMQRATVFDQATGAMVEDPSRDNSALPLQFADMDVVTEVLRTRISAAIHVPVLAFEPTQILRYEIGQQFIPHVDFFDPAKPGFEGELAASGQRIATFLIYLNDEYEGGETDFPAIGLRYRGKVGDALFWANLGPDGQPDKRTLHAGLPPTAGEKWIFSQWIRERIPTPLG